MSAVRIARVERVLAMRRAAADRVEVELAALTRAASEAEETAVKSRSAWFSAMAKSVHPSCSSSDLAELHDYARALGTQYESSLRVSRDADKRREACRGRLEASRAEVKKLEKWRDGVLEDIRRQGARQERAETDELAARIGRAG